MSFFIKFSVHLFIILLGFSLHPAQADDGSNLWLKYDKITDPGLIKVYSSLGSKFWISQKTETGDKIKDEIEKGFNGLFGTHTKLTDDVFQATLIVSTVEKLPKEWKPLVEKELKGKAKEGYFITQMVLKNSKRTIIASYTEAGLMYGIFQLFRSIQTQKIPKNLQIASFPKTKLRILNHWDNLNRTVERGYAGFSIWNWHTLPEDLPDIYEEYARANASIGINGTVLTNVNANALILSHEYLLKVQALAKVFRPFNIKVYLTAKFYAPMTLGKLPTADPKDTVVVAWWNKKAAEIYTIIPDFGGFLVKANSEGEPGPQKYGSTHAEGANLLANAVKPYGGVVIWRAFVYESTQNNDRATQAFNEFEPLDGKFSDNVMIQIKNGPVDFQPREPLHPLFGSMYKSNIMAEVQITQEYFGFSTHLVYLGTLFEEFFKTKIAPGKNNQTVANSLDPAKTTRSLSGISGVANTGTDRNWTGHLFGQANWYCFGRMAWDTELSAKEIAQEWIVQTISRKPAVANLIQKIMMESRENAVNYMTPLGLHHIMALIHHYGPAPWVETKERADWSATYYHKADSIGLGFDRTTKGSNAVNQYDAYYKNLYNDENTCPENMLLWFHHVSWNKKMKSGNTLWDEMCYKYQSGVDSLRKSQKVWNSLEKNIDKAQFLHVRNRFRIQEKEAVWWKDACLTYFQSFSKLPFPKRIELPLHDLNYYKSLQFKYVPGL